MKQNLGTILIIAGLVVTLLALFICSLSLLISGMTNRTPTVILEHPVRSFLIGLLNFLCSAADLQGCWRNWAAGG